MEVHYLESLVDKWIPTGPISWLNPTTRRSPIEESDIGKTVKADGALLKPEDSGDSRQKDEQKASGVFFKWRARDNRKGRHALEITPSKEKNARFLVPPATNTFKIVIRTIWRMFWYYPVWDVSYLVATIFTLGSVVWVINSFFVWLPHLQPKTEFPGEVDNAGGITAFIGATIFEIGSVFLMIEAVNENRSDCFGWCDMDSCSHHHQNMKNLAGGGRKPHNITTTDGSQPESKKAQTWTWWPKWHELRSHYLHDIGFLGCLSQFLGATVFWISGFTALASIQNAMSEKAVNGAYWAPQVIGGIGFIISSFLLMLETQNRWYLPAPTVLGYWVGLFNHIGGWGFTISGIFGYWTASKGTYQVGCSTFWGSWAFLIGSLVQWYESLNKHPVDVKENADRALMDINNPSNPHAAETETIPDVVDEKH